MINKLKIFTMVALALSLSACGTNKKAEPIKVLTPMGAPALSLLGLYGDKNVTIDSVDGSDVLSAEFNKKDGYDVIVAPINLGAKLISGGKSEYQLDSVVTWGNLYLVGSDEKALTTPGTLAAFGEKAVPQKVLMSSMDIKSIVPTITYFNSVNDVQAQLLTQKASVGLMAEPAASATIAKAKEKGLSLKVLKDLQAEYQIKNNMKTRGYPQAALFVKKTSVDKTKTYLESAKKFSNETSIKDEKALKDAIEKATVEKLGVPNAEIVQKTWKRQNIKFVKATEVEKDITTFLNQFKITLNSEYYTK